MTPTLKQLRAYAIQRSLFPPEPLASAMARLGYVQADPIRAPARAQDLILRHRVSAYRAGDLERAYPVLDIEEDCFVNYGFVSRKTQKLLHPRYPPSQARNYEGLSRIEAHAPGLSDRVLALVRDRGAVHPKEVAAALGRTSVGNYWGGFSSATTKALNALHYLGLLRIARRDAGIRVYELARHLLPLFRKPLARDRQALGLVQLIVDLYAPLPEASLRQLVHMLAYGAPHLEDRHDATAALLAAGKLRQARVDGVNYLWPAGEKIAGEPRDRVYLLAPFDPMVWDRRRFQLFWGWDYRFEAYTPPARRKLGYYALPMLWRDEVIGWANLSVEKGRLRTRLGFVTARPPQKSFARGLDAELARMRRFLGLA